MAIKYTEEQLNTVDKSFLIHRGQICFREENGTIVFFNEAEAVCNLDATEPETLEVSKRQKRKGKKESDREFW